ncbi:MAG: hypothetical protein M1840_003839 [Geoglossum simile]|nr:MAG: hypothetical protein M1840_003839 [Geoglossum simile]
MSATESKQEPRTGSAGSHLQQTELTGPGVRDILTRFGDWLRTAQFEKEGENLEKCVDSGLTQACQPLLVALDIAKKVTSQRWGYTVLRITGPRPAKFQNPNGFAYLIPIRIADGNPTASGKQLAPGWSTYMTEEVEVSPALDCLFVLEL